MKLRKGDKVEITKDYEWKYGEPSIYGDEQIWYLVLKLNGYLQDPDDVEYMLKRCGITYNEALDKLTETSILNFTIH